ncbi:hypothetical protein FA13DRAFT_1731023 [Coprinellus micaceus]|uniref:Uncharacterized protein n=1 Tax=Coprinellus micaceus TaxID=71717 RepID=A0A4Y7TGF4_COPMI|nr:hypothetical protein FA13DRAFT_1731023 [Coprinellus micaceus]
MATSQQFTFSFACTIPTMLGLQLGCEQFFTKSVLPHSRFCFWCCAIFAKWPGLPFKLARLAFYSIPKAIVWVVLKKVRPGSLRPLGPGSRPPLGKYSEAPNFQRTYGGSVPPGSRLPPGKSQRHDVNNEHSHPSDPPKISEEHSTRFWTFMRFAWVFGCIYFGDQHSQQEIARAEAKDLLKSVLASEQGGKIIACGQ